MLKKMCYPILACIDFIPGQKKRYLGLLEAKTFTIGTCYLLIITVQELIETLFDMKHNNSNK